MRVVCKGGVFAGGGGWIAVFQGGTPCSRALYTVYPINTAQRQRGSKVVEITRN